MEQGEAYEGWAILELMGHRRMGGYVKQVEMFGTAMCRIDVPGENGDDATQFYGGGSIYCLTPTTEEIARGLAASNRPAPVNTWDLPRQPALPAHDEPDFQDTCENCGAPIEACACGL